ncbi:MAG TPA: cupin domain-containing protein [Bryobacteraceae bacterium]|nr:cupin domain-containing protein [Bryobacteraceae bacterium]
MLKAGEEYENPVTGERAVIRVGTDTTWGERLVVDLYVQPGGSTIKERFHPGMEVRFTMLHGQVGFRLAGREGIAEPGVELIAPPGTLHAWWNDGPGEALLRVEMRPAIRFEAMIRNAFGLAQDGKPTNRECQASCKLPPSPVSAPELSSSPGHHGSRRGYYLAYQGR